jgi:threonine aldolase
MRRAMADAPVGDDVYGDDPSVNLLQERAANLMGKEAALFVPSGTMGNAVGIMTHTRPGDEMLVDPDGHSMLYEVGLPATLAHVLTRQFKAANGVPDVEDIRRCIHAEQLDAPGTRLIVLENTHNRQGGAIMPLEIHRAICALARESGVAVHLDGARLLHAAIATGTPAREYAAYTDSVTFCLSKGLGCPVGSVLCGTREFIGKARRMRKMLGGGMRQAGILAAAGIYALDHNIERLADDHGNAKRLARGVAEIPGLHVENTEPPTNMVYFTTDAPAAGIVSELKERHGVLCNAPAAHRIRMVTHLDVNGHDVDRAIAALRAVASPAH